MTVGIVGLGLVGGSLGLDLLAAGRRVVGSDTDPATTDLARRAGIDVRASTADVARTASLLVVAVPAGQVEHTIATARQASPEVVITDVTSVKGSAALGFDVAGLGPRFVGGHPMAGTERSGFAAARRGLLAGATWLLTPQDDVDLAALRAVLDLALAVDAAPLILDADDHDRLVAAVSHVTHLLSFGLHGVAGRYGRDVVDRVAGPSFRDATRVAASDPEVWADITVRNRDAVRDVLTHLQEWLDGAVAAGPPALARQLAEVRRHPAPRAENEPVALDVTDPRAALPALRRRGRDGYVVTRVVDEGRGIRLTMSRR